MDNPLTEEKTIYSFTLLTYLWVILLSVWGGAVNYINKVKSGATNRFNLTELIGDIFTSGFVGLLTFWLCQAAGFNPLVTAACVGISGHMGARAVWAFERYMTLKMGLPVDNVSSTVITTTPTRITTTTITTPVAKEEEIKP